MPRSKPPLHEPFESFDAHGKFAKICLSMLNSPAWASLEPSAMGLYLLFKARFYKTKAGDSNCCNITFPFSEYSKIRTYSNQRTFWRDLDQLIESGFIRVVSSGAIHRLPTIYGFSSKWRLFGTHEFAISPGERRMKRPRRKDDDVSE